MIAPRNVSQKKKEDIGDQEHPFCKVVKHCMSCVMHQVIAIEVWDDLHSRGQNVIIESLYHCVQAFELAQQINLLIL